MMSSLCNHNVKTREVLDFVYVVLEYCHLESLQKLFLTYFNSDYSILQLR